MKILLLGGNLYRSEIVDLDKIFIMLNVILYHYITIMMCWNEIKKAIY